MPNITYYLGAGASYQAMPIQNELSNKMVQLAELFLPLEKLDLDLPPQDTNDFFLTLKQIGYWGKLAEKNHSIDSYANSLWRNNHRRPSPEVDHIKIVLSYFFTYWMKCTNPHWKSNRPYESVDNRILYLMNRVIDDKTNRLKSNIKFVTWNYDLQLEAAFIQYVNDVDWKNLKDHLNVFVDQVEDLRDVEVCHLNGTHGYITTPRGIQTQIRGENTETPEYVYDDCLVPISTFFRDKIFTRIGFAWDDDDLSIRRREAASLIFSNTDHLVIIGYSFPEFNDEVDKMLFKKLPKTARITAYASHLDSEIFEYLASQVLRKNIKVIRKHPEEYPIPKL